MITATFIVGKEDVLALARHYYSTSPTVRKTRLWTQLTVPILVTFFVALGIYQRPGDYAFAIPVLIIAALWAWLYPRYHNWYLMQNATKMFGESSYQKAFGSYTVTLDDDGILSTSPIGGSKSSWSGVNRVSLTDDHLLIFLVGPQGYPVPRSQVADATIQEIKAFVEERLASTEPTAPRK